ncbi:carbohydrate ABC transporter permease [Paenibacillus sp. UNC451MF]|uniref:carbohydrate ABC transporter permease n=1 Tax=Paenibacillus sp. UNC451MF TaxID=1449063 RepID=UPI00055C6B76|nr:carbohydrate ABC transporter permease [Paenibacillus sp. UNC451MF]
MSVTAAASCSRLRRRHIISVLLYTVLGVGAIGMVFPFVWMVVTSFKLPQDVFSLQLIPKAATISHYAALFERTPFIGWVTNSFIVACITTISVALFDTVAGYILAQFSFHGKQLIFIAILSTMMVPTEMLIIPWYIASVKLEWVDTYIGILFPGLMSAFGIFLMKQFMEQVPQDLLDAARIDGMNEWNIMFRIAVPLVRPALATLCILTFLSSWNAFIWPLIVTQSPEQLTIPVGIAFFSSEQKDISGWAMIMTAATLSVLPLIIVFLIFQKQIIRGIALTGLK